MSAATKEKVERDTRVDVAARVLLRRLGLDEGAAGVLANFVRLVASSEVSESIEKLAEELRGVE